MDDKDDNFFINFLKNFMFFYFLFDFENKVCIKKSLRNYVKFYILI
jgi:hypothetical protein